MINSNVNIQIGDNASAEQNNTDNIMVDNNVWYYCEEPHTLIQNNNQTNINLSVALAIVLKIVFDRLRWIIRKLFRSKNINSVIDNIENIIQEWFSRCGVVVDFACIFTNVVETNGPVRYLRPNDRKEINTIDKGLLRELEKSHKDFTKTIYAGANLIPEKICKRFTEVSKLCNQNALIYKSIISGKKKPAGGEVTIGYIRDKFTELTNEIRKFLDERINIVGKQDRKNSNVDRSNICRELLHICKKMTADACNFTDSADFSSRGCKTLGHPLDVSDKGLLEELLKSCGKFTKQINTSACFIAKDICNCFYEMRKYCAHNLFLYANNKGFIIFPLWNNEEYEMDVNRGTKKVADDIHKKFDALEDDINEYIKELDR